MSIDQLYICEKPSQARDIAKILGCKEKGDGFLADRTTVVSWCLGHLLEMAAPAHYCEHLKPWRMDVLPVIPDKWETVVKESCKKQFNVLKKLIKSCKTVIIATDADREGEVIAREILAFCQFKGEIKRLWLSALDDASIKKALADIRAGKNTEDLYYAGLGRQRADWLIGMNMTMAASVLYGKDNGGVLSVGRVQTPTLKLIVERDAKIENFQSKKYFELTAQFVTAKDQIFTAKWQPPQQACDEEDYCLSEDIVMAFAAKIRGKTGQIEHFEDKLKKQSVPTCLSLSQLQKLASSQFGLSAQKTLDTAQSLYETHKVITYPRTDCGYLPESQFQEAVFVLNNLKKLNANFSELIERCDINFKSPTWNDKKITAHHGIIPTLNTRIEITNMREEERKIYELICRYYLAQFLGDYEYSQRSVNVLCEDEHFKATSHTPIKYGWKMAFDKANPEETELDEPSNSIPTLQPNEVVKHITETLQTKQTTPPARFTEGTLIDAMKSVGKSVQNEKLKQILKETAGIGTEATRAAIIETLFKRNYIEKKGKHLVATAKGKQLIALLPTVVCDPLLTAEWEHALETVAQGQLTFEDFLQQQTELIRKMVKALQDSAPKTTISDTRIYRCLECSKPMIRRKSNKHDRYFWGCSGFPTCRYLAEDREGIPQRIIPNLND